ncbi:MAG: GAF domain-containing protein [Oscillospiraceae bacterium]|nr:GAF domain-containing protein [Oscillospiraceae bacterium]
MTDYTALCSQLRGLVHGIPHYIANLANASALLYDALDGLNWAGFYFIEGDKLVLGPFQGKIACIEIGVGKGVCGASIAQDRTLRVDDVHTFKGHIACDSASNSEIVIPLHKNGSVIGVLDIDSTVYSRFTEADQAGLEAFARVLEEEVFA